MPLAFLSEEFFTEGVFLANADPAVQKAIDGLELSMAIDITDAPNGDFTYHIAIADGTVAIGRGDLDEPDARVRNSYDVAVLLAKGELANQMALLTGKIKISGGLGKLVKHQKPLDLIQGVLSDVEATY
jgi:putative sterol carrier protein